MAIKKMNKQNKILILGAYGRLGKILVGLMESQGYTNLLYPTHRMCDLLDPYSYEQYFHAERPEAVINLAAKTTNINLCKHYPASICRETVLMNISTMEMCKKYEVKKLVNIITSCAYDGESPILKEEEFYNGSPHPTIMPHGLAKRTIAFLGESYASQYHMNVVNVAMNSFFGCGDWSKPASLKFLDALIVKIVDAKLLGYKTIELWGSGKPRREVLYTKDAAQGLLQVFENYDSPDLINVGTGEDKTITEWAKLIAEVVKWKGELVYNREKPDGQFQKLFDVQKMKDSLNWIPPTDIKDAIKECVEDYKNFRKETERKSYRLT